nr:25 kda protein p25, peptide F3 [cattle, brain, Peptide Partial, 13 aa] [Bos taurus]
KAISSPTVSRLTD